MANIMKTVLKNTVQEIIRKDLNQERKKDKQ